jgi:uncharacterized protein YraI
MRSTFIAALTASAVLAMPSVVFAQTAQQNFDNSNTAAHPSDATTEAGSISAAQESAIPYRACTFALGWVNGRLQCRNN